MNIVIIREMSISEEQPIEHPHPVCVHPYV